MRRSRRLPLLAASFAALALAFAAPARADVLIEIDKAKQQMTVTVDGDPRYTWPVSTGKAAYDTPSGDFQPFRMARHHFSREWDDAPMPYSIFFTQEGHAIHGSYEMRRLGTPASHGCVRLSPANAAVLFALIKEQGVKHARVVLSGEIPTINELVARGGDEEPAPRPRKLRARNYDYSAGRYYGRRYYYRSPFSALFGGRW